MEKHVRRITQTAFILLALGMMAEVSAQPVPIKEIPGNSTNFIKIGDLVYFVAGDALWRTDGTEGGTIFLKNGVTQSDDWFVPNAAPEYGEMSRQINRHTAAEFDGDFYFLNNSSKELWKTDGTPGGTVLLKSSPSYDMRILDATDSYLFFLAPPASGGPELYRTDGTVAGTQLVKDINSSSDSQGAPYFARAIGNVLFFAGDDGTHGAEPWRSDGTSDGTYMIEDTNPGSASGVGVPTFSSEAANTLSYVYNNLYYFSAINPVTSYQEPWVSDGTEAGTMRLAAMDPAKEEVWLISYKVNEDGFVYFEARRFFEANDPSELWKTSGTPASTSKVSDIGPDDNDRNHFRNFKDDVHFLTWGRTISNLWKSDGTTGGTTKYFEYYTHEGNTYFFEPIPNYLVFYGVNQGYPTDLYHSDGTTAGSGVYYQFNSAAFLIGPREMTKVGDYVFFADHDGLSDRGYSGMPYSDEDYFHLMQTDGDTVQSMRTMFGINTTGTDNITDYDGRVVFTTHTGDEAQPSTLWIYEPVEAPNDSATFTLVNAGSDRDVRRVTEGAKIVQPEFGPASLNIRYNPTTPPGSVVFKINDVVVRTETAAPYSLAGDVNGDYGTWSLGSTPGTYQLTATSYSGSGGSGTPGESLTVTFTIEREGYPVPGECTASGTILREYWDNVSGNNVSSIPVETTPTSTSQLSIFEGPTNADTNYGARIRGYICPPVTGNYTFWIASNDNSELWLSTDDSPANRQRIAYVSGATTPRQWDKFASQKSAPVNLIAGRRYYVEALHKQGVGTDNLAVGWQLPDGTMERPIPGNRLSPYGAEGLATVAVIYPEDGDEFVAPADITIQATATDGDGGTITRVDFRVSKDGGPLTKIGEDATEPYSFLWENVAAGTYDIYAYSVDNDSNITGSQPVSITVTEGECTASGTITRDYWANVSGDRVSDVPVNSPPTSTNQLTIFEGPSNIGDRYATRIRGYICPPVTGDYTFWIASNDHSELWLSTDDDPANKVLIAWVSGATNPRQWNKFASQRSTAQTLVKGQRYYIEALHKESIGTDHIAVGWTLPDGTLERPISGSHLSPFEANEAAAFNESLAAGSSWFDEIDVYPNPASSDDLQLTISGFEGLDKTIRTQVEIVNLTGEVVYSGDVSCGGDCNSYLMELNKQLVPGVYLVNLKTNSSRISKRLLVK